MNVTINQEYANLVPEISDEEYDILKRSIKENGLYVPIIVNQDGMLLDGHHRYKVCQEIGISPSHIIREFKDELDEKLFVIDCNLTRRQLNNFQRTEQALKSKPIQQAIARRNESLGGKGDRNLTPLGRVDETIGERAGVSRDTVRRVEKILASEYVTDKVKEGLRVGALSINEAYEMIAENERISQFNQEFQPFYQKIVKAQAELNKAEKECDEHFGSCQKKPQPTALEMSRRSEQEQKRIFDEAMAPFKNFLERQLDTCKAIAAAIFWVEYRERRKSDEEAATETLRRIEEMSLDKETGSTSWAYGAIEKMLYHAVAENEVDKSKIKDSKIVQDQLQIIRLKEEAANRELDVRDFKKRYTSR